MPTRQAPVHSGFDATTTAKEIMAGRHLSSTTAIVTGGYSGLGLEAARMLASAGASVIVPARDVARANGALQSISGIEVAPLDLMDPDSIDAFARTFLATGKPLHLLLNSAGIMAPPLQRDSRGYESQFSTNHLGHYHLAMRVWSALRRANGARVVSVSSLGHRLSAVDFEDPNFEQRPYDKWKAYGQSKTANALFAVEADRLGENDGIRAFSLHPGAIFTPLSRHLDLEDLRRVGAVDADGKILSTEQAGFKTVEQGAATLLWCATSPQLDGLGGVYCENCDVASVTTSNEERGGVRPWAVDPGMAQQLWDLSRRLTGAQPGVAS
ncbi:oxidoreductase [Paraburkholderia tropica]|uniref:oxidoreductase n=1 Tax=Paraburkholderia tropica TaxID=92647 RepID=UPI0007ED78EC|nr:oxidoreductase [Paraburkholderia tropica]OBR46710.1 oxidoreductase [Paraburkholderia tropica]